jgi:XRE family transcriptional regulator, fatty acid utilization regulator
MVSVQDRIILGLKVRQFRQELGWNFEEMSRRTGLSVSYLNEIEKGKKYPQLNTQEKLAQALGISREFLVSKQLTKQLAPLSDLLQSNFLNELPLDRFGIDLQQVVEIIAKAPDRVNAFISAFLQIARDYSLREENFYFAALRAYQELHMNYFDHVEEAALVFRQLILPNGGFATVEILTRALEEHFGYEVVHDGLERHPDLLGLRSVYVPSKKQLLLHPTLSNQQRILQLARELAFNVLELKDRPLASNLLRIDSFEQVLSNYHAGYFAVALLIDLDDFTRELETLFQETRWQPQLFLAMMQHFKVGPEVIMQRFNVMAQHFNLQKMYFMRVIHHLDTDKFDIDKELHLNQKNQSYANALSEHYCRRWRSLTLLEELQQLQQSNPQHTDPVVDAQVATFAGTGESYWCLVIAKPGAPGTRSNVSVTFGIYIDDHTRRTIRCVDDPAIAHTTVNITCERCGIADCERRVAAPSVLERRASRKKTIAALRKVTED